MGIGWRFRPAELAIFGGPYLRWCKIKSRSGHRWRAPLQRQYFLENPRVRVGDFALPN